MHWWSAHKRKEETPALPAEALPCCFTNKKKTTTTNYNNVIGSLWVESGFPLFLLRLELTSFFSSPVHGIHFTIPVIDHVIERVMAANDKLWANLLSLGHNPMHSGMSAQWGWLAEVQSHHRNAEETGSKSLWLSDFHASTTISKVYRERSLKEWEKITVGQWSSQVLLMSELRMGRSVGDPRNVTLSRTASGCNQSWLSDVFLGNWY